MIYNNQVWLSSGLALCITIVMLAIGATCAQLSVGISSDMSKPTYGFHGPTSSQVILNDHTGLNVQGTLKDLLGPPIKMAQGFNNVINGSNMAGIGQSLKSGGAVLGVDSKLLEAAGGAHLFKGGLLLGGAGAKIAAAGKTLPGKKIASIVELPVKVIAMKNLAEGKTLTELGRAKGAEAEQSGAKGDRMIQQGNLIKSQGFNQVIQGATEGIQGIGNAVQQTSGNAATALKLLPIIFDMHSTGGSQVSPAPATGQQSEKGYPQQQHQSDQSQHMRQSGVTGGSIFGGLGSLMPGLNGGANDPFLSALGINNQHRPSPLSQLFGAGGSGTGNQHHYAVLNATNPLTSLLLNPNTNPFLLPLNGALDPMANPVAAPLTQAFTNPNRHPIQSGSGTTLGNAFPGFGFGFGLGGGSHNNQGGGSQTSTFNLFPGIRYRETVSSGKTNPNDQQQQQQQQHQEKTSQQVAEQQPHQQYPEKTQQPQQQQQQQQQQLGVKNPPQQQEQQHPQNGAAKKE